jgi:hypothetical protein
MPAYLIIETDVHGPDQYQRYKAASPDTVAAGVGRGPEHDTSTTPGGLCPNGTRSATALRHELTAGITRPTSVGLALAFLRIARLKSASRLHY